MALGDVLLSFLTFPQQWRAGVLEGRVLLLPVGDPQSPVAPGLPMFAGTAWPLRVTVLPSPDALLSGSPGSAAGAMSFTFTATPPAGAANLFQALATELAPVAPASKAERLAAVASARIRKQLPDSYVNAFPFERPTDGTTRTDEFGCALRDTVPARETDPPPPASITWGAILSFALRQPALARALGLIYDIPFPAAIPGPLAEGGWVYVELDPAGAVQPTSSAVLRSYAARLPALEAGADRSLFAAVLFPVGTTTAGNYDQPLAEAASYADGFAKIVHASQALTADAASSGHNHLRPATDAGIDLGWDDEQVTRWLNRQLDAMRARLGAGPTLVEAPLGVSGYRIDVSTHDEGDAPDWQSLCSAVSIDAAGNPAPLRFPPAPAAAVFSTSFSGELTVEPAPVRSVHAANQNAWLPQHFTRWQGGSLVANDPTLFELAGTSPRAGASSQPGGPTLDVPPPTYKGAAPLVPLRYGTQYHFRCRLADLTGGGPTVERAPSGPALHPIASTRFLRHVPPKTVRLETNIAVPAAGDPTPPVATVTTIDVWRPLIGYPELTFAGIVDPAVIDALIADAPDARNEGRAVGVNDPDVTHVHVSVQVRAAAHDIDPAIDADGFRELYSVTLPFPAFDANNVLDRGVPLTLTLDYVDERDVAAMTAPGDEATLPLPRARDIRLRLKPICADKPDYFGAPWVREGLTAHVSTRADAEDESSLFVPLEPDDELNGIMLRPGADMMQRLADQLDVAATGLTLTARPGERVVFGASGALRHSLAGDGGAITFASANELVGRWLGVINVRVNRDWTWDGLEDTGFVIARKDDAGAAGDGAAVGQLRVPFAVAPLAVATGGLPGVDRRATTRLIFFDAVDPNPPAGGFPRILNPQWSIEPRLRGFSAAENAALGRTHSMRLPIAAPPRQTPRIISAGWALSPYERADDYSTTSRRRRALWIELEEPIEHDEDALFARVLAYGPDPLLAGAITHQLRPVPPLPFGASTMFDLVEQALPHPPAPPPLAIDPEPIRVIVPAQPEDNSGRDAMIVAEAGSPVAGETTPRHFLVPLPPGIDPEAPEMFGFWSYEFRVGHLEWSLEQACFGRPLIVKGMQHPAPSLRCTAFRHTPPAPAPPRIVVTAPFATAVFEDQKLTRLKEGDPRTRLWALLYAQVAQADGRMRRNVLIGRAPARPRIEMNALGEFQAASTRDLIGVAEFDPIDVELMLAQLALPPETPLSVIVVELLPGDHLTQTEFSFGSSDRFPFEVGKAYFLSDRAEGTDVVAGGRQVIGVSADPLGRELGTMTSRRILRCSPLTSIAAAC